MLSTQPYSKEIAFVEYSIRYNSESLLSTLQYLKETNRVEYSTRLKLSVNFHMLILASNPTFLGLTLVRTKQIGTRVTHLYHWNKFLAKNIIFGQTI